ncbi:DUF1501 domain-containing protein [Aquincola sp. S2]|uniref:DUF1501 domain-containing protein n=1 Tax=Pseudaquabacterium terrae TaxID=2732868 RepID=A0ABX2ELV4_9BURK|nr:DUF1501 domain-containing protein [Aquabacterium terrae]NRF69636.1 DUF1501 domain-containing protein [Aquabacterium terrae]
MNHFDASRRQWLGRAAALSGCAAGAPLALNLAALGSAAAVSGSAAAQSAGDYKALVCVFLFGGNDAYNMVLPTDSASWLNYTTVRNQAPDPIALLAPGTPPNGAAPAATPARLGGVLPLAPLVAPARAFALHPVLGHLQTLFNQERRLAIVSNVGPLVMPTTKAQLGQELHPRPLNLFSHNDQQNTWQALAPEGATRGWGGRMGDRLAGLNSQPVFTSVSAAGNAVWLAGDSVQQYQVGSNGAIRLGSDANGRVYGSPAVAQALQRIAGTPRGAHVLEADLAAVAQRSMAAEEALRNALRPADSAPFGTPPASGNYSAENDPLLRYTSPLTGSGAGNGLAQQLQVVARMIDAGRSTLGARRQVFFVSLGGFDTHDAQNRGQADLLARLGQGLAYFDATMGALGLRNQVTLFTASDFGRSFTSNGDGTDHGWGGHHVVLGGAVRGGTLVGSLPVLGAKNPNNNQFDSSPDQLGNGALLPSTSVDQLGATLGRWFGLSDSELLDIFPNLKYFSQRNLGFMA